MVLAGILLITNVLIMLILSLKSTKKYNVKLYRILDIRYEICSKIKNLFIRPRRIHDLTQYGYPTVAVRI